MKKLLLITLFLISIVANAQKLDFKYEKDSLRQTQIISKLAKDLLTKYKSDTLTTYLDNKFRVQIAAGQYQDALNSLDSLKGFYRKDQGAFADIIGFAYNVYLKTKIKAQKTETLFSENYTTVLNETYSQIEESFREYVPEYFSNTVETAEQKYTDYLIDIKDKDSLTINEALKLTRLLATIKATRANPLALAILDKNEKDNYIIQDSVTITTRDNSKLSAILIRPRNAPNSLPTVFVFNIYASSRDKATAIKAAKNGYAGIVVNTRGKLQNSQSVDPFEHDAKDAYDIIDWISKQSWSNGKVGMYGGSYLGFAQWASLKYFHPALKTIVPQVAVGIGIDYPMDNNVFMSYMLRWIHYVENNNTTDIVEFRDTKKWKTLYEKWYKKGLSFRSLDSLDGRPNKTFQKWLDHPAYDDYWKNMTPQKERFSKINIPVLSITGYFDADQRGAFHYFNEHYRYNNNAEHYLLIGPYDHGGAQNRPSPIVQGYKIDSVAKIDIGALVYEWFDYTLKGGEKPKLIKDKVNYQVMGSNSWKHAASLKEMNNDVLTLYLDNTLMSEHYGLTSEKPKKKTGFIKQEIDFKDRSDYETITSTGFSKLIDTVFQKNTGISFVSPPFESEFEINGSFTGQINLEINKKDVDLFISLIEVTADNKYIRLSHFLTRASYTKDKSKRQLLKPNKKEKIPFSNTYMTSKLISKGSRLLVVVSVNKNPYYQINYGTGKDVSNETIKDARVPLKIKWFNDSFVRIPIKK